MKTYQAIANQSATALRKPVSAAPSCKDEVELWNDFRNGDKGAFAYIYVRFFPVLYRYGCRICNDRDLVQDCIQDLFLELSKAPENLSATTSIRYYLYRCIRRKIAVKASAMHRHRFESLEDNDCGEFHEGVTLPFEFRHIEMESAVERRTEILKALQFLTKKQRKVIQLRFFENMSHKEISTAMSINISTVYNLISLATSALKGIIRRTPMVALILLRFFFSA